MISRIVIGILSITLLSGVAIAGADAYQYVSRHYFDQDIPAKTVHVDATDSLSQDVAVIATSSQDNQATTSLALYDDGALLGLEPTSSLEQKLPTVASSSLLSHGTIEPTWKNNSWGVVLGERDDSLIAEYTGAWSAVSLYSSGIDLRNMRSVELSLTATSTKTESSNLYLAFYQGNMRLGAVYLTPYITDIGGRSIARVSIADMELRANYVTSVILESEHNATIILDDIHFSEEIVESRKPLQLNDIPAVATTTPDVPTPIVLSPITEPIVYFAGMKNGWSVVPRRAVIDVENTERSVTGRAIKVSFNSLTSAISFIHPQGFDTREYSAFHLRVYGGVTDHEWQQLYISFYDREGKKLGTRDISDFSSNGKLLMQVWNDYTIPLEQLDTWGAVISTIDLENASVTQVGDHMWIDDCYFLRF